MLLEEVFDDREVEAMRTVDFAGDCTGVIFFAAPSKGLLQARFFVDLAALDGAWVRRGLRPFACKGDPMQPTNNPILNKKRIILFKLLSAIKIHA